MGVCVLKYYDGKLSENSKKIIKDLKEKYSPEVFNRFKRDLDNSPFNPYKYFSESRKFFRSDVWIDNEAFIIEYFITDKYLVSQQFKKDYIQSYKTRVIENYDNIFSFFATNELLDVPEYKKELFECKDLTFKEIEECIDKKVKKMEEMEITYNCSLE